MSQSTGSNMTEFESAKALQAEGRLDEAAAAYAAVPDDAPDAAKALNNLGTIREAEGNYEEAEECYRRGIALQADSPILWYNLGHVLHRQERLQDAVLAYLQSLELDPSNGEAYFNLGNALSDQARHESAVGCYNRARECGLNDPRIDSRLGTALLDSGRPGEALAAYQRAVEADPTVAEEWFHVGLALETLRKHDEAAESYGRSLEISPDVPAVREGLARSLNAAGKTEAALLVYREWLQHDPGNPIARHMIAALSGDDAPERASDDYVRTLFDGFADSFDRTLARLDYRAPQLIAGMLKGDDGTPQGGPFDILDAGCGTGLAGPLVKPFARSLIGVDLSPAMLRHAAGRGVYTRLHNAELCGFLREHTGEFDIILSADTFIYFGDLQPVLIAAAAALRPGGRLLFSVEQLRGESNVRLNSHGRYAHSEAYLRDCIETAGLNVKTVVTETIRTEGGHPVAGMVLDARLPA